MKKPEETFQKQIIVLNYEYPPVGGGAGQVSRSICSELVKKGLKTIVITGWVPGLKFLEHSEGMTICRVPMLKLNRFRTSIMAMASYVVTAMFPALYYASLRKTALIHAHFVLPVGIVAWTVSKLRGTPYILTLHGGDVPGALPEQTDGLFRFLTPLARRIVEDSLSATVVSNGLKELAEKSYPPEKLIVIANGIDSSWLCEERSCNKKPSDEIRLVASGRFTHQKNFEGLVRAVRKLDPEKKWRLDLLGDGPFMERVRKEAEGMKNVHLPGWVEEKEVKAYFRKGDIFLLPSFSEGLSVAGLQAMASGCALVVSDIPMNHDLLDEGENGYFCSFEPESIAEAIEKAAKNLERFSQRSLEKVKSFFWEEVGEEYFQLMERHLDKP